MPNINNFTRTATGFKGEIVTMSVQQKNVRVTVKTEQAIENAPSQRVFVGRAEIGTAKSN